MKCQILFSWKNEKNIINLLSADLAQRVAKVNPLLKNSDKNNISFRWGDINKFCRTLIPSAKYQDSDSKLSGEKDFKCFIIIYRYGGMLFSAWWVPNGLWNSESHKTPVIWQGFRIRCNTCRDLQSRRSSCCRETDRVISHYVEKRSHP